VSGRGTLERVRGDPPQREERRAPRRVRTLGLITGAVCALVVFGLAAWIWSTLQSDAPESADPAIVPRQSNRPVVSEAGLLERTGVKIVQVAVTGDGGLLDLRFQVLDPDKAAALHDLATPPAIVGQATGIVAKDLFMGHSHSGSYKVAVTYYMVFVNPGNLIHRGDRVSVLLGDAQVQNLRVE
jgi:hypothetical protein